MAPMRTHTRTLTILRPGNMPGPIDTMMVHSTISRLAIPFMNHVVSQSGPVHLNTTSCAPSLTRGLYMFAEISSHLCG